MSDTLDPGDGEGEQLTIDWARAFARRQDPHTSHAAAASTDTATLMEEIYRVMERFGHAGCTSDDIESQLPHVRSHSITPRFRVMIERGMIELTGETRAGTSKRQQQVRRALPPPFIPVPPAAEEVEDE